MTMKRLMLTASVLACLSMPHSALACSICRCGDPTFNALGKEGVAQTGLRVAFDWDEVEKTQGPVDEQDSLREQRETLLMAYGLSDRFDLFARIPYSQRHLTETDDGDLEHSNSSGLADPEVYAQARLWSSRFEGDVGMRSSIYLVFGVKTDWGMNDASRDGERLDEHVQPGTGSTDWFAGLSGSYQVNPRSAIFASAQYRQTGRNDFGYQYGRVQLLNVAYEHKLGGRWDAVLEANYRHAGRDEIDEFNELDPDTGGSLMYLTPRLLFDAGRGWVIRASAQVPLSQAGLNGAQHEKTVFNVGLTYLFSKQTPRELR
jgi:predicted porin